MAESAKAPEQLPTAEELFSDEFSVNTLDLPELLGIIEPLSDALERHNSWVSEHGYSSLAAVEALLAPVDNAECDLRSWVEIHQFWLNRNPSTVQTGPVALFEILREACHEIFLAIPNDPDVPNDGPLFFKLSPRMEPYVFEQTLCAKIKLAVNMVKGWMPEPKRKGTGGRTPTLKPLAEFAHAEENAGKSAKDIARLANVKKIGGRENWKQKDVDNAKCNHPKG